MSTERLSTGIDGLDPILDGGIFPERNYLIRGGPGTGKTTFGLHFLTAEDAGSGLYITLDQTKEEIRKDAEDMGFELSDIEFLDLSPTPDFFSNDEQYDVFESTDVEWGPVTDQITEAVNEHDPDRVFVDSLTQFRHLSPDVYQFRKQALSFSRFLVDKGSTVLMASEDRSESSDDKDLQFLSDTVISLKYDDQRYLQVEKFRGSDYEHGEHHLRIRDDGFHVYSRGLGEVSDRNFSPGSEKLTSGVEELDTMLNGGIERSTVTMFSGPSGVGKTTTGLNFLTEGALNGEKGALYSFEEYPEIIKRRCESLNIPINEALEMGNLSLDFIRPDKYTSREFLHTIKDDVEQNDLSTVMIDSLTGWNAAIEHDKLDSLLRELTNYLTLNNVTVVLINEVKDITGKFTVTEEHISHLSDNIIYLRYVEFDGELRKIIGVLKKRMSDFERSIREIHLNEDGIQVGESMKNLHGLLGGSPKSVRED